LALALLDGDPDRVDSALSEAATAGLEPRNVNLCPLSIKTADDDTGTFTGLASVFDNLDAHGDIVRRGAFTKSLASGQPIPLLWMHKADDPRNYVGDVIEAVETDEGLLIKGRFDLDIEHGQAAYRNVKGRRIGGLSIGYAIRNSIKTASGHELIDVDLIDDIPPRCGEQQDNASGSLLSSQRGFSCPEICEIEVRKPMGQL
jgi:HK97 family phage prohead protease